ncbi:MAG: hypothetical protein U9O98_10070 [Asgard group archaeon]|nr:hypothetical protein [Asgard group archaeon]
MKQENQAQKQIITAVKNLVPPDPYYGIKNMNIGVIVEAGLWMSPSVQVAVNQYLQDLNYTGYKVFFHTNPIASVQNLRALLQTWYTNNSISGAVLIGNLPYAQYYHPVTTGFPNPETFICDLYLMDMDGTWWDVNPTDGIYDDHNATGGADIYPEIYIGRINAISRTLGGASNAQNIITLLNRTHDYRTGQKQRRDRALTYIDDDWQPWANNWTAWLNNVYPARDDIHTPKTYTNASDWLNNRLIQNYEWAHLCAHSGVSPSQHYFGPGGTGEGTVTALQIHNKQPTFNFYNLFCCHGSDWLGADSLGTTYLYSSNYSVGVIGSSKSGSMLSGSSFYNPLSLNFTLGQALYNWFQEIDSYTSYYVEWFYGMNIMGDPFLSTTYDYTIYQPLVSSSTHPHSTFYYGNSQPSFQLTPPYDVNGITGYYYILDQNPYTTPTPSTGTFTSSQTINWPTSLTDGTWYFHIVAKDGANNVGSIATHYQINIDKTGPALTINTPEDGKRVKPGLIPIEWTVTDQTTSYDYAQLLVDGVLEATIEDTDPTTYDLEMTEEGSYEISIAAYDIVGNQNSSSITIEVYKFISTPLFKYLVGIGGGVIGLGIIILVIVLVTRKKK